MAVMSLSDFVCRYCEGLKPAFLAKELTTDQQVPICIKPVFKKIGIIVPIMLVENFCKSRPCRVQKSPKLFNCDRNSLAIRMFYCCH